MPVLVRLARAVTAEDAISDDAILDFHCTPARDAPAIVCAIPAYGAIADGQRARAAVDAAARSTTMAC